MHDPAVHDRQIHGHIGQFIEWYGEWVGSKDDQIGEEAGRKLAPPRLVERAAAPAPPCSPTPSG